MPIEDLFNLFTGAKQRQEAALGTLATIMKFGGSIDNDTLIQISRDSGINPQYLHSIMSGFAEAVPELPARKISESEYDKKFGKGGTNVIYNVPSMEGRKVDTEISKEERMLPIKKKEREQAADIELSTEERKLPILKKGVEQKAAIDFDMQKKLIDEQYNMEAKKSANITIPEHKAIADYTLVREKELAHEKLNADKELARYERELRTKSPTPEEKDKHLETLANIEYLKSHAKYFSEMGDIRKYLQDNKNLDKTFVNDLATFTKFMTANDSRFYTKGKNGNKMLKEYEPGSKEETDFISAMDAAGIKYQKSTRTSWGWTGKNNVDVFIPVTPQRPTVSATSKGGQKMKLDRETAAKFLEQAGGDPDKARVLAADEGYLF